jgi:hypothetical protein
MSSRPSRLEKALRREPLSDTKYFFHKGKKFLTEDAAKWDEMADWLHKNANACSVLKNVPTISGMQAMFQYDRNPL